MAITGMVNETIRQLNQSLARNAELAGVIEDRDQIIETLGKENKRLMDEMAAEADAKTQASIPLQKHTNINTGAKTETGK